MAELKLHSSKLKMGLLVVPCVLAVVVTLQADGAPELALEPVLGQRWSLRWSQRWGWRRCRASAGAGAAIGTMIELEQ